jgi:hypothetical protein
LQVIIEHLCLAILPHFLFKNIVWNVEIFVKDVLAYLMEEDMSKASNHLDHENPKPSRMKWTKARRRRRGSGRR